MKKSIVEHNTFSPFGAVGKAHTTVGCKIVVNSEKNLAQHSPKGERPSLLGEEGRRLKPRPPLHFIIFIRYTVGCEAKFDKSNFFPLL